MKDSLITLLIILVCIAFITLTAFNTVTYAKISAENKTVGDVTPGGAKALAAFNGIICGIFVIATLINMFKFYNIALKGNPSNWLNLIVILITIALLILCAFNAATYYKIYNENKTVGDVTPGGALTLAIINIIICIILVAPLVYYSMRMYKTPDIKTEGMKMAIPDMMVEKKVIIEKPGKEIIKIEKPIRGGNSPIRTPFIDSRNEEIRDLIKNNIKRIEDVQDLQDELCNISRNLNYDLPGCD